MKDDNDGEVLLLAEDDSDAVVVVEEAEGEVVNTTCGDDDDTLLDSIGSTDCSNEAVEVEDNGSWRVDSAVRTCWDVGGVPSCFALSQRQICGQADTNLRAVI